MKAYTWALLAGLVGAGVGFGAVAVVLLTAPAELPGAAVMGREAPAPARHCLARALGYPCTDEPSATAGNPL